MDEGRPEYDRYAPLVCERPSADVRGYYGYIEDRCRRSDEVVASVPLSGRPKAPHGDDGDADVTNEREAVPRMIEGTAGHSGHLEIARELLDHTGLGSDMSTGRDRFGL